MQFALMTAAQDCTWSELLEVGQAADAAPQLHSASVLPTARRSA